MDVKNLLAKFNINPVNAQLYETAFTHRSFLNEVKVKIFSNERLEFLGDSVLSLIISTYLYTQRPEDPEGQLTNLRAYIVKTDSLAKAANQLELGQYLRLSRGEKLSQGRENQQLLANTYEALLGAIYLDQGIETTIKFVSLTLLPMFKEEVRHGAPRDFKSQLQELSQSKFQMAPKYRILNTQGPDHAKRFTVGVYIDNDLTGKGEGTSKQQAEEEAARKALAKLLSIE